MNMRGSLVPARVLIFADDQDVRLVIKDRLEYEGYGVTLASRAEELEQGFRCAAAVLDLALYDSSRLSIVYRLWALNPQLPMIILTGHDSDDRLLQSLPNRLWEKMRKPYDSDDLKGKVRQAVNQRQQKD